MSLWGVEADAIIAMVRGAVPAIPPGAAGAERGVRPGSTLTSGQLPHLFVYNPTSRATALDQLQSEVRTTYEADLWAIGTQEEVAAYRDAVRAALETNRTLGGLVVDCQLTLTAIVETGVPGEMRVLAMTFETLVLEG